ncbi:tetratricopeptide repeat-containing sensor histidine kinase [Spirosoma areae]
MPVLYLKSHLLIAEMVLMPNNAGRPKPSSSLYRPNSIATEFNRPINRERVFTPFLKKGFLFFWFFLLISLPNALAQVRQRITLADEVDSLAHQVKKLASAGKIRDTTYASTLTQYAYKLYISGASQQADSIARQSEMLSRKLNFGSGVYLSLVTQAGAWAQLNQPEKAIQRFQQIIRDIDHYKLSKQYLCKVLGNLGMVYRLQGRTREALDATMQAARIETRYNLRPRNSSLRATLGFLFRSSGQIDKALTYVREGIAIARENNDLYEQASLEVDLGALYNEREHYKESIVAYGNALTHSRQSGFEYTQVDALNGLALNYSEIDRPQQALKFGRKALALAKRLGFTNNIANAHYTLGEVYTKLKQYAAAETELSRATAVAQESGSLNNQALFVGEQAVVAALRHNYRSAYTYKIREQQLRDSMMTGEQKVRTNELVTRYETEKKEAQIKLLRQQAQLREKELTAKRWQATALLIGGLMALLLGGAVSAWLLNRARVRRLEEAQKLRQQIAHDLHDEVGSTLSSISLLSGMVNKLIAQNRPESVERAIQKINTDARQILEAVDEIIWTINPGNDSLHRIALRLQEYAQPLMESKNIQFSFVADSSLDNLPISMEVRRNLFLIGKEAINNLVKYSEATEAAVRFERKDRQLQVVIEDNGRGFDPALSSQRTGQASMQQRAEAIGGSLEVRSAPEQGTRLLVTTSLA